ncbi:MAG TPA: SDR family oxidoreductase [Candidatus Bathyarchaeia archaeon]|nr:SDR family oxidoreductase [Candidatus Bathyarchaeia archaeon]
MRSFARSSTVDLKNRKIRVNAVSPSPTATPMVSSVGRARYMSSTSRRVS